MDLLTVSLEGQLPDVPVVLGWHDAGRPSSSRAIWVSVMAVSLGSSDCAVNKIFTTFAERKECLALLCELAFAWKLGAEGRLQAVNCFGADSLKQVSCFLSGCCYSDPAVVADPFFIQLVGHIGIRCLNMCSDWAGHQNLLHSEIPESNSWLAPLRGCEYFLWPDSLLEGRAQAIAQRPAAWLAAWQAISARSWTHVWPKVVQYQVDRMDYFDVCTDYEMKRMHRFSRCRLPLRTKICSALE